jgi:hypothetical protein
VVAFGGEADIHISNKNFNGTLVPSMLLFSFRHQKVVMSKGSDYRKAANETASRIEWCERKLSFERKHKALSDLADGEDWLDGKISSVATTKDAANEG